MRIAELQAQYYNAELKTKFDENSRLIEACAALEIQLKADILSEQQANPQLRQTLSEARRRPATAHASLTWRITSPLSRK